ncbi:MAG TPA: DNA polymerase III subunit alpha, partial [Candidatus Polarisedimenticolia bacterium]|nr:DNA polymerase III subunit alpha [Candidatus Polarisedimenticolia bacterium]
WARLCRLITEAHRGDYAKEPAPFSLKDLLLADREGLWVVSPDLDLLEALARGSGAARLALSVGAAGPRRAAVERARRAGLVPAAAPDVFFVDPASHPFHRLLRAIDRNTKLSRLPEQECVPASAWLMPAAGVERLLPDCPGAMEATLRIAADCAMAEPPWGATIFPSFEGLTPAEAFVRLKKDCFEGARRRYGGISRAVQARLDRELEIIHRKGFADYFLVVQDIVKRSPRTCGRGSAAASLVSYSLGITHVDPVRYDLFFERFLNEGRVDPPDIDVDFAWDERDAVLEYVFSKYGTGRAAMVSNHLCFRGRAAVREVAKVYGLPEDEIRAVTGRLSRTWQTGPAERMVGTHPLFADVAEVTRREPWPEILRWATRLEGHPRHLSVHCGGVVIVPGSITDHVPVEPAAKGVGIIQWEKDATEESGLVKIDLLGNRSIAVIRDALAAVKAHHGVEIPWDRFSPLEDLRTQGLIRRGDTIGVFYVESPAMRQLQKKTGTGDFEHLVIHSSIIRPAANRFIREYIRRLKGEPYRSIHPLMDELMAESYGIMVYQEDVAKVAIAMAGFDAASADDLRKVLSKKHKQRKLADYRTRFYEGAIARGFSREALDAVWEMILSFAGYSFCKPHSASYALVSFKSAYLRAHYPAEFMAAVISNQGGYYATFAYVSECRRMGLSVLLPDVNESDIPYTGINRRVRVGLMQVQGLSAGSMEAIAADRREHGPFRSLEDFLRRVPIDPSDARLLIKAGAFDGLEPHRPRPDLMWRWARWSAGRQARRAPAGRRARQPGLFDPAREEEGRGGGDSGWDARSAVPAPPRPGYDDATVLRHEVETLGFLLSRHPLSLYARELGRLRHVRGADLQRHVGRTVTTIGWLVTGKVVSTKGDEPMEFVSFEDTSAIYETTFFPDAYRRFCHRLSHRRPYVLRGRVEEDFGAVTLTVSGLEFLDQQARQPRLRGGLRPRAAGRAAR